MKNGCVFMNKIITSKLNKKQIEDVNSLASACSEYDGLSYEPYTGEDEGCDIFVLAYDGIQLIGFLSCFCDTEIEMSGLVLPKRRINGIFSDMYNYINEEYELDNIVFSGRDEYPGMSECAHRLGFGNSYHEYLMSYTSYDRLVLTNLNVVEDNGKYTYSNDNRIIGHCSLYIEERMINIYDVYVNEEYRGQGFGSVILSDILYRLSNCSKQIILQVSERNKAACRLYLTHGFKIIDSVVFYSKLV